MAVHSICLFLNVFVHFYVSLHNVGIICSKLLRKPDTLKSSHDIDKDEWRQIDDDLKVTVVHVAVLSFTLNSDIHFLPALLCGNVSIFISD